MMERMRKDWDKWRKKWGWSGLAEAEMGASAMPPLARNIILVMAVMIFGLALAAGYNVVKLEKLQESISQSVIERPS